MVNGLPYNANTNSEEFLMWNSSCRQLKICSRRVEIGLIIGFGMFLPRTKHDRGTGQETDNSCPVGAEKHR